MSRPLLRRVALPDGALAVGAGLAVTGVASYAFLILSARAIGPDQFGGLSILWSLVFLIGGCLVPFEQDVSRRIVARRLAGVGSRPIVVRAFALGLLLVGTCALAIALAGPWLSTNLFNDQSLLVAGLALGMLGYLVANLTEGTLAGNARFGRYGLYLGGESLLRITFLLVCLALGVRTAGPIGLALGIAPLLMAVPVLWGQRHLAEPGPPVPWRDLVGSLSSLLAAALLSFVIVNGTPVLLQLLSGPDSSAQVGVFTAALIIARIPLFLWQAVQAGLLPGFTSMASRGEIPELRNGVVRLGMAVAVLAVVGGVIAYVLGPTVVGLLFGSDFPIGNRTVGLLALGSGGFVLTTVLALAIVALGGTRVVPIGWAVGFAAMLAVVAVGGDPLLRVELAFLTATWSSALVMAVVLRRQLARGATVHMDDAIAALNDLSYEV